MTVGRIFLGLFGMAMLVVVVTFIAIGVDITTASGGGCGGG